jgi:hypothetical protein
MVFGCFWCQYRAFGACFVGVSMASVLHGASIEREFVEQASRLMVQLAIITRTVRLTRKPPRRDRRRSSLVALGHFFRRAGNLLLKPSQRHVE